MRPPRPGFALVLFTVALGLGGPGTARAAFPWFKSTWGNVLVATDTTEAGKKLTPPTREQPVYYNGLSMGRHLGWTPGDEEPTEKELNRFVADVLAKQGYLGAKTGVNEPTLLLVLQWGYLTPNDENLLWFLGYHVEHDIAAPSESGLLGPEVFRRGMRSRAIETILEDAQGPIYGILISAFEYKSARTLEPVILWQTRIGLPANGKTMAEALPAMALAAGPAIGRPAEKPVLLDADAARKGTVNLGDLKFLDSFVDPARGPGVGTKK